MELREGDFSWDEFIRGLIADERAKIQESQDRIDRLRQYLERRPSPPPPPEEREPSPEVDEDDLLVLLPDPDADGMITIPRISEKTGRYLVDKKSYRIHKDAKEELHEALRANESAKKQAKRQKAGNKQAQRARKAPAEATAGKNRWGGGPYAEFKKDPLWVTAFANVASRMFPQFNPNHVNESLVYPEEVHRQIDEVLVKDEFDRLKRGSLGRSASRRVTFSDSLPPSDWSGDWGI